MTVTCFQSIFIFAEVSAVLYYSVQKYFIFIVYGYLLELSCAKEVIMRTSYAVGEQGNVIRICEPELLDFV